MKKYPRIFWAYNWFPAMFTITTRKDGEKGYSVYVDGVVAAEMPGNTDMEGYTPNGGGAIDPNSTIRFCGRQKPGSWSDEDGAPFDDDRYYMGELAHFAIMDEALDASQIADLYGRHELHIPKNVFFEN